MLLGFRFSLTPQKRTIMDAAMDFDTIQSTKKSERIASHTHIKGKERRQIASRSLSLSHHVSHVKRSRFGGGRYGAKRR